LEELVQTSERLNNQPILNVQTDRHVLFATTNGSDHSKPVAINLLDGEIVGLSSNLLLNDSQWHTSEQLLVWAAPQTPGESASDRTHVYNIFMGEEFIMEGDGGTQRWPTVSGNIVVWSEIHGTQGWNIYAYNVASKELQAAVARPGNQIVPKIDGEWMVYMQCRSDDMQDVMRDIYLHRLGTGEDMLLGPSPFAGDLEGDTYGIDNGRVLWIGWSAGEEPDLLAGSRPTLHLYDLQTRAESVVDVSPVCTRVPVGFKMAGDLILFGCDDGFCGYDLAQSVFFDVPYPHNSIGEVYLSETHVVFRIQDRGAVFWDYVTPGASPMPSPEHWLTPQPMRFRWFAAPITR
jgi:hypothetical protein